MANIIARSFLLLFCTCDSSCRGLQQLLSINVTLQKHYTPNTHLLTFVVGPGRSGDFIMCVFADVSEREERKKKTKNALNISKDSSWRICTLNASFLNDSFLCSVKFLSLSQSSPPPHFTNMMINGFFDREQIKPRLLTSAFSISANAVAKGETFE